MAPMYPVVKATPAGIFVEDDSESDGEERGLLQPGRSRGQRGRSRGPRLLTMVLATMAVASVCLAVLRRREPPRGGRVRTERRGPQARSGGPVAGHFEAQTVTTTTTSASAGADDVRWAEFKARYGKAYESAARENESRGYFEARLADLEASNAKNGRPVFGVTAHADRPAGTRAFARGHVKLDPSIERKGLERTLAPVDATAGLRALVDWRDDHRDVVTPVKNQGQCGSCWAFSAAEQIESQLVLAGCPSVELSPQQLTSCTDLYPDACCMGCGGGDPTVAYEYVASLHQGAGLAPESVWPYAAPLTPEEGECLDPSCTQQCSTTDVSALAADFEFVGPYATVDGFAYAVPSCTDATCDRQNVTELALRLHDSPVSVCLNAGLWDDYTGGVLSVEGCGGYGEMDVDHCVQLVGYNNDAETPYWIVRNSWAASWGEEGYIYLEFGSNTCGIANEATIASVVPIDTLDAATQQQQEK